MTQNNTPDKQQKVKFTLVIALVAAAIGLGAMTHPLLAKTATNPDKVQDKAGAQDKAPPDQVTGEKGPNEKGVPSDVTADTYRQLNLFSEVFERVRRDYVKPVSDKQLVEAAVNGMLTNLDPHSSYMNDEEFKNMQVQTRGEFGGLGIEVTMDNGVVKVVSPIDDTPAAKAGIKPNDLIVGIDDAPVMGLTLNDAVDKLRGKPQTRVTLAIVRGHQEPFDVTLTRDIIHIKSVKSAMKGDIGYLRINQFSEETTSSAHDALEKMFTEQGGKLKGLVVDLRNNPGGLLDQSISVGGLFLDKGDVVVSTKGRHEEDNETYNTDSDPIVRKDLPMVVLINSGSASAAEIVAGALQDHKRAVLIGTQSFGKGSVQTVMPVPGYGAIRLTTAYYFTPSGRSIQATGIKPNIEVRMKNEKDAGFVYHEADLKGALNNPNGSKAIHNHDLGETNEAAKDHAPDEPIKPLDSERDKSHDESVSNDIFGDEKKDVQLQRALEMLHGMAVYHDDGKTGDKGAAKTDAAPASAAPAANDNSDSGQE